MSSNNGILVKKVSENEFQIRYIPCIDNEQDDEHTTLLCTESDLETAMNAANYLNDNEWYTEYGISYIDNTVNQRGDRNDMTKEELQKSINDFNNHDEISNGLRCAHCGSDYLTVRANMQYHNHEPLKNCIEEIYECECGQYTQVIWKLDSVHKLGRIVI